MSVLSKPQMSDTAPVKRCLIAPILLSRPTQPKLVKGQYKTLKLHTVPTDADSPTYELTVVYFVSGTPEEWRLFRKSLEKVIFEKNSTTGPAKYALARQLLIRDALTTFNAAASDTTKTNDSYKMCMAKVNAHIFPACALQF